MLVGEFLKKSERSGSGSQKRVWLQGFFIGEPAVYASLVKGAPVEIPKHS